MQNKNIQKNVFLKFHFPKQLKYKFLANDEYNITSETFTFEKKKGPLPKEHKFKVESSFWLFYPLPVVIKDKNVMKQQLTKGNEFVQFKFNDLSNILINTKIHQDSNVNTGRVELINDKNNENIINDIIITVADKRNLKNISFINDNGNIFHNTTSYIDKDTKIEPTEIINDDDLQISENQNINNIIDIDNLPDTIPINENEDIDYDILPNTIPVNKNEPMNDDILPNSIPVNETENINDDILPNTIPVNKNEPMNDDILPNTIPMNANEPMNDDILPDTIPINENELTNDDNLPNTIPINENELMNDDNLPNTIPINKNNIFNDDNLQCTIPINENEFGNTVPYSDIEYGNTVPYNEISQIDNNSNSNNTNHFSHSNSSSNSNTHPLNKNPTFLNPNDIPYNNGNTQPYELVNDFSQITQTQNYEASYGATQEYVEMDTQECTQDLNDFSVEDIKIKYPIGDDNIVPGSDSEFENSSDYTLSNLNGSSNMSTKFLKVLNPLEKNNKIKSDDNSNKRSFLQLDEDDEIISYSSSYSSSKRKKINDSDSEEVLAPNSDSENEMIFNDKNNKARRAVSDLTSVTKDNNQNLEMKNSLSQEYNPTYLETQMISSPDFNHFDSSNENDQNNISQDYIETQISSQLSNISDTKNNRFIETQNIQSHSQESMIFSPPRTQVETQKLPNSQDYILISPTDNHHLVETQKISSQEELTSPGNLLQFTETQKITSPSPDEILLSPRIQKIIRSSKKESLENDDDLFIERNDQFRDSQIRSSQGAELLSPDNNFNPELDMETQKLEFDFGSPSAYRKPNIIEQTIPTQKIPSQESVIFSPKMLFNDTHKVELSEEPENGQEAREKSQNKKENLPLEIEASHLKKHFDSKNNQQDIDSINNIILNSKLNLDDSKDLLADINQDIDPINNTQEDQDQSPTNSQYCSDNPLFSPEPLSPEFNIFKKRKDKNTDLPVDNKIDSEMNTNIINESDSDKENEDNMKNNNQNNINTPIMNKNKNGNSNKILDNELLTKTPDSDFNKNSTVASPLEYELNELNSSILMDQMLKDENYPKPINTNSNIFTEIHSKSFMENETNEENIINNFIENYLNKTKLFDDFNNKNFQTSATDNILSGLKEHGSLDKMNPRKKRKKGKDIMSNSSQESNDKQELFWSSPIPVLKARTSDDLSLLSEREIKDDDLGKAFLDLSLDNNKFNNEKDDTSNTSNDHNKLSSLFDSNNLNDTSGLIVSPSSNTQTPDNKFPNIYIDISDKKKQHGHSFLKKNSNNNDSSFINMDMDSKFEFIVSPNSSLIENTPTPFKPRYRNHKSNNTNNDDDDHHLKKIHPYVSNRSNPPTEPSSPKDIKEHSLNSKSFINVPIHSPGNLQNMLSSQSSNPRDFGIPSSIPKTISTISSFDENPLEDDIHNPLILPPDIEIADSLHFLVNQYEKGESILKNDNSNKYPSSSNSSKVYQPKKKYNFIGVVVHVNDIDTIQPRNKNKAVNIFDTTDNSIYISSVLISDSTRSFFPVIFWRNNSNWIEKISKGDIILFVNFTLSNFKKKVMANTVGWGNNNYSSRFFIIKNINDKSFSYLNDKPDITKKALEIQNWAKTDIYTKFLFKDLDQASMEPPTQVSTFLTIKQLAKYKNKCINIQGIPISIMKDIKIDDNNEPFEFWKVEILDVDNNIITIQSLIALFSDFRQYIHIDEQKMYDFYDLIVHEDIDNELVLYVTKYTKIQISNNIPTNVQKQLIKYTKSIKPKDFESIESLIKSRFNGLASVDAFISKIIFNRTNTQTPLEYPIMATNTYDKQKWDTIDDILNTIQIYCNHCNVFLFQQDDTNITALINGIQYKDTVDQKINYFIQFLVQKAFWKHCHHLKDLVYVYCPIQLILQDTINENQHSSQDSSSSPPSSPISSVNSKSNSIYVFMDIHSTQQFYGASLKPEDFIKIKGGLKRRGRKQTNTTNKITLTMIQNHLQKANPFTLASSMANPNNRKMSMNESSEEKSFSSTPDYSSKSVDIGQATIFEDLLTILSHKEDPSRSINFNTNRSVTIWNQNLKKYSFKRKKNTFVLSCHVQENELKTNLYNVGHIYCKDFKSH